MGKPKALLDWAGQPLVCYQVEQLRKAGVDEVIVVLGYRADDIHRKMHDARCRVMLNPRFFAGRAGSLRIGAKAVSRDADAIVIVNVDQPRTAEFFRGLIEAHQAGAAGTRPTHGGRHGHPVIVAGNLRTELMEASDESGGLKGVLEAHQGELADWPSSAECELDLNTPDEYDDARRATQSRV